MASDSNGNQWYQPVAGLSSVGSYQISGIPFATGSLAISNSSVTQISFPQVTKFVIIKNLTSNNLRVGFSENGVNGTNYFVLTSSESFAADLRVTKLFLRGDSNSTNATVVAGLTGIPAGSLPTNWSGSVGVG